MKCDGLSEGCVHSKSNSIVVCWSGHIHHPHPTIIHPHPIRKQAPEGFHYHLLQELQAWLGFVRSPNHPPCRPLAQIWSCFCFGEYLVLPIAEVLIYMKVTSATWWNLAWVFRSIFRPMYTYVHIWSYAWDENYFWKLSLNVPIQLQK